VFRVCGRDRGCREIERGETVRVKRVCERDRGCREIERGDTVRVLESGKVRMNFTEHITSPFMKVIMC